MSRLDVIDEKILRELSRDGRISNIELADRATLNRSALGAGFTAYIAVGLSDHSKASQEAFERSMSHAIEVRECHNVTGSIEYLLRVEVSDLAEYKVFHRDVLGTLPQVSSITSYIVMSSPKDLRA